MCALFFGFLLRLHHLGSRVSYCRVLSSVMFVFTALQHYPLFRRYCSCLYQQQFYYYFLPSFCVLECQSVWVLLFWVSFSVAPYNLLYDADGLVTSCSEACACVRVLYERAFSFFARLSFCYPFIVTIVAGCYFVNTDILMALSPKHWSACVRQYYLLWLLFGARTIFFLLSFSLLVPFSSISFHRCSCFSTEHCSYTCNKHKCSTFYCIFHLFICIHWKKGNTHTTGAAAAKAPKHNTGEINSHSHCNFNDQHIHKRKTRIENIFTRLALSLRFFTGSNMKTKNIDVI